MITKIKTRFKRLLEKAFETLFNKVSSTRFFEKTILEIPTFNSAQICWENLALTELQKKFSGTNLMRRLSPKDWAIWVPTLYRPTVVIAGGYTGVATQRMLEKLPQVKEIHVYEPILEFAESFQNTSSKVKIYNEAIWEFSGDLNLEIAGDHTFASPTQRENYVQRESTSRTVACADWQTVMSRIDKREVTLFMNCEGSEYQILKNVLESNTLPNSIIVQTHMTGNDPYVRLYELRAQLADKYMPIFCFDWAWEVWSLKLNQHVVD